MTFPDITLPQRVADAVIPSGLSIDVKVACITADSSIKYVPANMSILRYGLVALISE